MAREPRLFYAYPGEPIALGETITNAVEIIKDSPLSKERRVRFTLWQDMAISGKKLVDDILRNIDRSDVFACDLTYLNANVSFELGYAIGRFKRVWISLNSSISDADSQFKRVFFGLTGYGYASYANANELADSFLVSNPFSTSGETILGDVYRRSAALHEDPTIMYLKPPVESDPVIATVDLLHTSIFQDSVILDDPKENPFPTIDWYASHLGSVDAVLCHLLATNQNGHAEHNAKCSLIAGIARGMNKPVLVLAHEPYEAPVDYQGIIRTHSTASICKTILGGWISGLSANISRRRRRRPDPQASSKSVDLRNLAIGEPVAENERRTIDNYFFETSTYYRAMDDTVTIVVGRRGSGKSAQLYAMEAAFALDRRNHVCVVKPIGYETDGLVRVLQSIIDQSERGYLIESLWKFLIYSELGRSVYNVIRSRPPFHDNTQSETAFVAFCDQRQELFTPPFSERLDIAVRNLMTIDSDQNAIGQRKRVSELLHANQLVTLREHLGAVLADKNKVGILVDNLDGPWGINANVEHLSELLWGLLQVADDIVAEFQKEDHWRKAVGMNLTIFLRSDIFAFIQPTAAEQDKLPIQRIIWERPEVLRSIIEARLEFGNNNPGPAAKTWARLFPEEVVGLPTWDFVINTILPRPRDIIYLMREAIDGAINKGHLTVTAQDLLDARERYSEYVFRSILAEDDPRKQKLEPILYEFAGAPKILPREAINQKFLNASVGPGDHDFYLDLLCDVNFLAIATNDGFRYSRHEADRQTKRRVAMQIARNNGTDEQYQVSSAFWQVLQID